MSTEALSCSPLIMVRFRLYSERCKNSIDSTLGGLSIGELLSLGSADIDGTIRTIW